MLGIPPGVLKVLTVVLRVLNEVLRVLTWVLRAKALTPRVLRNASVSFVTERIS